MNISSNINPWTKRALELAKRDYLDRLTEIYKAETGEPERLDPSYKKRLEEIYSKFESNPLEYGEALLALLYEIKQRHGRFAFNHPYVPLMSDPDVRKRNPKVRDLLLEEIRRRGLNGILAHLEAPKELNRQIGNMFKRWVRDRLPETIKFTAEDAGFSLGVDVVRVRKSGSKGVSRDYLRTIQGKFGPVVIYVGSDEALSALMREEKPGVPVPKKGVDFVATVGDWFLLGEAKFQSDIGGNQDNQIIVGEEILRRIGIDRDQKVAGLFLLDGMPVIRGYRNLALGPNRLITSALLLPKLIVSFARNEESLVNSL